MYPRSCSYVAHAARPLHAHPSPHGRPTSPPDPLFSIRSAGLRQDDPSAGAHLAPPSPREERVPRDDDARACTRRKGSEGRGASPRAGRGAGGIRSRRSTPRRNFGKLCPCRAATTVNFSRPEPIPAAASHRPTRFTTQPSPSTSRIVRHRPNKESDRVLTDSTSSIDVDGNLFATGLLGFLACSPTSQALRGERLCRLDG